MKYLSLFSGIGGFELGIEQAYESIQNLHDAKKHEHETTDTASMGQGGVDIDSERKRLDDPVCVGYSEIDKYASQIYQKHFPNHKNYGDITKINADELPDFDFLVGGFPCQSFSIAGKRRGFSDTRGTLFFDIARILKTKKPRLLLLENVKGLLSHDNGITFKTIISTLDELGYDLQWQVLNSKNFGVPQNRERVFIVGHLRGTARPEVFPIGNHDEVHCGEAEPNEGRPQAEVSHTIRGSNVKADQAFIVHNVYGGFGEESVREFHDISPTLRTPAGGGHTPSVVCPTIRATQHKSGDNQTAVAEDGMRIRRLTPTECERLQGFPDGWTKYGYNLETGEDGKLYWKEKITSDTQRYKTLGNAVTVNVIQAIMERLL